MDPFSARLHAIHMKGALAKPLRPALQEESAPEGAATTGMPVRGYNNYGPSYAGMSNPNNIHDGDSDDEPPGSMSLSAAEDKGPGSMSLSAAEDEEARAIYPDDGPDGSPKGYQTQIHGLRQRVEELESEMRSLNRVVDQLTRPVDQQWSQGGEDE